MKYFTRLKVYKASNVLFNPETIEAFSYDWWQFVKVINNKVVFNNYNYSNSTCKHQNKVRSLLRQLNITIDLEVSCPKGLQRSDYLNDILNNLTDRINILKNEIAKPKSRQIKNFERLQKISELNSFMNKVKYKLS